MHVQMFTYMCVCVCVCVCVHVYKAFQWLSRDLTNAHTQNKKSTSFTTFTSLAPDNYDTSIKP